MFSRFTNRCAGRRISSLGPENTKRSKIFSHLLLSGCDHYSVDVAVTSQTLSFTLETGHHTKITDPRRLFGVYDTRKPKPLSKKPVNYEDINTEELKEILIHSQIPDPLAGIADEEEINSHVDSLSNWLYERTLKGIYTPAGSLTFSNSGLPDHHSPTP